MTTEESVEVILKKLLITTYPIESSGGFPSIFNYNSTMANKSQNYDESHQWFPFVNNFNGMKLKNLLEKSLSFLDLDLESNILLFHGTSWESALSIYDEIQIFPR